MDFSKIKLLHEKNEKEREEVILQSREIVRLSKSVIYALHRAEPASSSISKIKTKVSSFIKKHKGTKHEYNGSYKVAIQEYIEAMALNEYIKTGKLLKYDKNIDYEHYILGLCDLSGELVRQALRKGIEDNFTGVKKIRDFISNLYDELMKFDFRNGDIRKKIDSMRWDLKKLDDMVFELKMRDKI